MKNEKIKIPVMFELKDLYYCAGDMEDKKIEDKGLELKLLDRYTFFFFSLITTSYYTL